MNVGCFHVGFICTTGLVTTTRVTHASPAGVYAKVANRTWEYNEQVEEHGFDTERCPDIALQLINKHPGNKLKVRCYCGYCTYIRLPIFATALTVAAPL